MFTRLLKVKIFHYFLLTLIISGCVMPNYADRYFSNNDTSATFQDLLDDRYACLQDTRVRTEGATVNSSGGSASSVVKPNCSAFRACLASRGWIRSERNVDLDDPQRPFGFNVPDNLSISCTN